MPELNDPSLIRRCIGRDRCAWNTFVEQYSGLVFWAIKESLNSARYIYNQQDIEDIFQNVFVLLWEKQKLRQVINNKGISGWLVMVAANCARNYFRGKRERPAFKEPLVEQVVSFDDDSVRTLDQQKLKEIIKKLFGYLAPRESIALKLNYLYNKTHRQIGQILTLPQNTVSSMIKRAKNKLREELQAQGWNNF